MPHSWRKYRDAFVSVAGGWTMPSEMRGEATTEEGPRVAWISNYPAPYRMPVWARMSERVRLVVLLLWSFEPDRGWNWPTGSAVELRLLDGTSPTNAIRRPSLRGGWGQLRGFEVIASGGWEDVASWQIRVYVWLQRVPFAGFYESTLQSRRHRHGPTAGARCLFLRSALAVLTGGPAAT